VEPDPRSFERRLIDFFLFIDSSDRPRHLLRGLSLTAGVSTQARGRRKALARGDAAAWEHSRLTGWERRQAQGRRARERGCGGQEAEGVVDCFHLPPACPCLFRDQLACPGSGSKRFTSGANEVVASSCAAESTLLRLLNRPFSQTQSISLLLSMVLSRGRSHWTGLQSSFGLFALEFLAPAWQRAP